MARKPLTCVEASSGNVYFGFYKPWSPGVRWGHYWAVEFFTNDFTPQSLNIPRGLKRLWKRLNERYGAPILVEGSTRLKLAIIPWKLERGYQRLFDLLSILMELQWRRRTPVLLHAVLSGLHSIRTIITDLPYSFLKTLDRSCIDI